MNTNTVDTLMSISGRAMSYKDPDWIPMDLYNQMDRAFKADPSMALDAVLLGLTGQDRILNIPRIIETERFLSSMTLDALVDAWKALEAGHKTSGLLEAGVYNMISRLREDQDRRTRKRIGQHVDQIRALKLPQFSQVYVTCWACRSSKLMVTPPIKARIGGMTLDVRESCCVRCGDAFHEAKLPDMTWDSAWSRATSEPPEG